MGDDEELKRRIAQLQGRINRRKQQKSLASAPYVGAHKWIPQWIPHRGSPYGVRARGRAGRYAPSTHRNRTLVINNGTSSTPTGESAGDGDVPMDAPHKSPQWISVQGGGNHQLINKAVYDKVSQRKIRDMQETLAAKQKVRDDKERARLGRHFGKLSSGELTAPISAPKSREVDVNGIRFRVIEGGSKLIRVSDDPNTIRLVPRQAKIAGVTFVRSRHGNLYRSGLVKPKTSKSAKSTRLCPTFSSTGTCPIGPHCRFTHDPEKVAICKDFLAKGECPLGDDCDLSHDPTPHRVPPCKHFLRGHCTNDECRYVHVRVGAGASVCKDFAHFGYCEKGSACTERHSTECPDYANKGFCHKGQCRLPHFDRARQLRKAVAHASEQPASDKDGNVSDVSSDEESYSEDIDSDDDMFIQGVDGAGQDLAANKDFVPF